MKHFGKIFILIVSILISLNAVSQRPLPGTLPAAPKNNADTTKPNIPARKPSEPKPYKEIITSKAITANGFFKVHKIEDRYFFEIADSLMDRDILVVNRISKAAAGAVYLQWDMVATRLVKK